MEPRPFVIFARKCFFFKFGLTLMMLVLNCPGFLKMFVLLNPIKIGGLTALKTLLYCSVFSSFSEIIDFSHKKCSPRVFNIFKNSFRILEAESCRLKTVEADFLFFFLKKKFKIFQKSRIFSQFFHRNQFFEREFFHSNQLLYIFDHSNFGFGEQKISLDH